VINGINGTQEIGNSKKKKGPGPWLLAAGCWLV
jgi:hypothetical protein